MLPPTSRNRTLTSIALFGLLSVASAHGHDGDMKMDMGHSSPEPTATSGSSQPASYFQYGEHSGWIMAHIILMTIAWVFILPIGSCCFH